MRVVFALTVLASLAANASDPWGRDKFVPSSVGYYLNSRFADHLAGCGAESPLDLDKESSRVPDPFRRDPDMRKSFIEFDSAQLLDLFRLTFAATATPEQIARALSSSNQKSLLPSNLVRNPTFSERNNSTWVGTCSSMIQGAAKAGVSIPAAAVQFALANDNSRSGALAITKGTFVNPVERALNSQDTNPSQRLEAHLRLWEAYRSQPSLVGANYVTGITGFSIHQVAKGANGLQVSNDNKVSIPILPFVSASASLKLALEIGSEFESKRYTVLVIPSSQPNDPTRPRTNETSMQIERSQLPTAERIAAEFKSIIVDETSPSRPVLLAGGRYVRTVLLRGVPPELCVQSLWTPSSPTNLRMNNLRWSMSSKPTPDSTTFLCELALEANAVDQPTVTNGVVDVGVTFTYKHQVSSTKLEFDLRQLIDFSAAPIVTYELAGGRTTEPFLETKYSSVDQGRLNWQVDFLLEDAASVDVSRTGEFVADSSRFLNCPWLANSSTQVSLFFRGNAIDRRFRLFISQERSGQGDAELCRFESIVKIPLVGNGTTQRVIRALLAVPGQPKSSPGGLSTAGQQ